jgi:hypothetical protein
MQKITKQIRESENKLKKLKFPSLDYLAEKDRLDKLTGIKADLDLNLSPDRGRGRHGKQ